jgi:hypothetical protein
MKESLRKFTFNLFLLALVLTTLGYGCFRFLVPASYFSLFPLVPFFIFAVTATVHIYLVKASDNDARKFMSRYLGSMGVKLLIYILFLIVFLVLDTKHVIPFLISFLVCYVAFTLVEVLAILKHQKRS